MDQVESFLRDLSPQNNNATTSSAGDYPLFVIWAGANDVFFNPNISAAQSYLEIVSVVSTLRGNYPTAGEIVTVASPDLSRLPYGFYADEITKTQLRTFTDLLATLLENNGGGGQQQIITKNVDLRGLFDEFEYFASPLDYGFAALGKYGSCLVGVYGEGQPGKNGTIAECDDVEGRVYWDEYQLSPDFFFLNFFSPHLFALSGK